MRTARALRPLDATRLGQGGARPGNDPRAWVALCRVEEVAYDQGSVVVARAIEGPLMGEPITCDVGQGVATEGGMSSTPIAIGDICLIGIFGGDANHMPVVLAFVHEPETPPPATVNGQTIDADLLAAAYVLADPDRIAELALKTVRLVAEAISLGDTPDPSQPFVRGQAFMDALSTFLEACSTLVGTPTTGLLGAFTELGAASTGTLTPLSLPFGIAVDALGVWKVAIAKFKSHLVKGDALSTVITGE